MKKPNSTNVLFGLLGLCTILSIGGAVSSSLAWYAYASNASLKYSGTSVFDNGQLQIGVKSEEAIPGLVAAGMSQEHNSDVDGSPYYYFAPAGEGLTSDLLNIYLAARNYASNELTPVTTGQYDADPANGHSVFGLMNAPTTDVPTPTHVQNAAKKQSYSKITFIFRTFHTIADGSQEYVGGQEIWLTYAQARASATSSGNVSKSMRMYIERDESYYGTNNGFLFNPTVKADGATKVGGLLNLGYDQYYDFNEQGEILYGDYTINGEDSGISSAAYDPDNQGDYIYDINGKWDWDKVENTERNRIDYGDTFTAAHSPECPKYFANLNKVDIKTANYRGTNSVLQTKDSNGLLYNPVDPVTHEVIKTSVCKTGDISNNYIGEFDATIFLEGWDFSVTDSEQHHKFDFQLRFETNRIQED